MEDHLRATEEYIGEIDLAELIDRMFDQEPMQPFSLRMEAITQMDSNALQRLLAQILLKGCKKLFNKPMHCVTADQLDKIRKYFYMIGFDFDNGTNKLEKDVTDYHPDGTPFERKVSLTTWKIEFKPANLEMHPRYNNSSKFQSNM